MHLQMIQLHLNSVSKQTCTGQCNLAMTRVTLDVDHNVLGVLEMAHFIMNKLHHTTFHFVYTRSATYNESMHVISSAYGNRFKSLVPIGSSG